MQFYVYEHWRPDKGLPFYVGKGSGDRAYTHIDGKSRDRCNRYHLFVCEKLASEGLPVEVRIVFNYLDEEMAFSLEKSTISYWRNKGIQLTNTTDGGEGVSMRTVPPEIRKEITAGISASNKVKWSNAESRKKLSLTNKKKWKEDPVYREKMITSLKARDPKYLRNMRIACCSIETQKKRLDALRSNESRLKVSQASKKMWENPESREKLLAGLVKARAARQAKRKLLNVGED